MASADDVAFREALELEEGRHRRVRVVGERVAPAQFVEIGVELSSGVTLCRRAEAALEQLEVGAVDHRSSPRSSRRRAMMLRWISALPP